MDTITLHDYSFQRFIPSDVLQKAVKKMAGRISLDVKDKNPVFISILNGAFMFTADLMKHIQFNCYLSFVRLKSYESEHSSGTVTKLLGLDEDLSGKTVVILEDIIDTGATITYITGEIKKNNPSEIRTAAMFLKPGTYGGNIPVDYTGIELPDGFIVGYGLDYNGLGRNLKDIYKLKISGTEFVSGG